MLWLGIDVGGTFTDVVVYDDDSSEVHIGKSPSNPADPAAAVLHALSTLDIDLSRVRRFRHGATIATNTVLERKGAVLGVITTAGFRDVLIIGRGNRIKLYDIKATRPPGLVRRSRVIEVPERTTADGSMQIPLDENAVAAAAHRLRELEVEAIAVCFLHSYANPQPEQRAAEILADALPDVPITRSSEVLSQHREYPRFATAALNAYVAPRMAGYLGDLHSGLEERGLTVQPEIMTSSGGSWSFKRMARLPVNSMLSGPAGGVIGAASFSSVLGIPDVITYDMGGTSTDTCMIRSGQYALAAEGEIGSLPNHAPQIEINTVGAGGGSIAYLDVGGFLNVGPRSAGAIPGPACYGRGGTEPTVTDANVVLGRFRPAEALGGEIEVDVDAAERAVASLAKQLGLGTEKTAEGIVRIAVTRMTGAIKEISVMRGIDPRDFALFAFGGAGPLHAALIAEDLELGRVIIPPTSGVFSAYGLLVADHRRDLQQTKVMSLDGSVTLDDVRAVIRPMQDAASAELADEGFAPSQIRFEAFVDMRYEGQAYELTTALANDARALDDLIAEFHRVYEERYAHADEGPVEAVGFRLSAYGVTEKPRPPVFVGGSDLESARTSSRPVRFSGRAHETPVYRREALPAGAVLAGPALIEENGAATLVPPGFTLEHHESGALLLTQGSKA